MLFLKFVDVCQAFFSKFLKIIENIFTEGVSGTENPAFWAHFGVILTFLPVKMSILPLSGQQKKSSYLSKSLRRSVFISLSRFRLDKPYSVFVSALFQEL